MIVIQLDNGTPMELQLMATKLVSAQISPITDDEGFGICTCECEFDELVFHSASGLAWQNDKSSFLGRKVLEDDNVQFFIKRISTGVEVEIVDNTYGDFYDFPFGYNYKGIIIHWRNVFNELGNGDYQIIKRTTTLGGVIEVESWNYLLRPYSDEMADGSVRIEWYQNGRILNNVFNFEGLNWYQSMRVWGRLWNRVPSLETDIYQDGDRVVKQIRDKITDTYDLILKNIPSKVANAIIYDGVLANELIITDYCSTAFEFYKQSRLYVTSLEAPDYDGASAKVDYTIKLSNRIDNQIKFN